MIVLDTAGSGRRRVGATFPDGLSGITALGDFCAGIVPLAAGAAAGAVSIDVAAPVVSCLAAPVLSCLVAPPREHAPSRKITAT